LLRRIAFLLPAVESRLVATLTSVGRSLTTSAGTTKKLIDTRENDDIFRWLMIATRE